MKKAASYIAICLLGGLFGVGAAAVLKAAFGQSTATTKAEQSEYSEGFMDCVSLAAAGKIRLVDCSEPWILSNATISNVVIVGAHFYYSGTNINVNNSRGDWKVRKPMVKRFLRKEGPGQVNQPNGIDE